MFIKSQYSTGITLIALVITIIVLLILAGVSIAMLTGQNGILTQASNAKQATEESGENEKRQLSQVEASTHLENYDYTDAEGNTAKIPAGFAVSNVEGENLVSKGLVIIGTTGNEYVWIPCTVDEKDTNKLQYKREIEKWYIPNSNGILATKDELISVAPSEENITNGISAEILNEISIQVQTEINSIKNNGGYYIGRYESGNEQNNIVIKANQIVYTKNKWIDAYEIAKKLDAGVGAKAYLCSSYSWDTAVKFIETYSKATNYGNSRENLNENWYDKEVKDKRGNIIKKANEFKQLKTGLTKAKANIYDMGGNVTEFTTELIPNSSKVLVVRGGGFNDSFAPAGYRFNYEYSHSNYGFRCTLFLK